MEATSNYRGLLDYARRVFIDDNLYGKESFLKNCGFNVENQDGILRLSPLEFEVVNYFSAAMNHFNNFKTLKDSGSDYVLAVKELQFAFNIIWDVARIVPKPDFPWSLGYSLFELADSLVSVVYYDPKLRDSIYKDYDDAISRASDNFK